MTFNLISKDALRNKFFEAVIASNASTGHLSSMPPIHFEEVQFAIDGQPNWRLAGIEAWPDALRPVAVAVEADLQRNYRIELPPPGGSFF